MEKAYNEAITTFGTTLFWLTAALAIGVAFLPSELSHIAWRLLCLSAIVWGTFIAFTTVVSVKLKEILDREWRERILKGEQ